MMTLTRAGATSAIFGAILALFAPAAHATGNSEAEAYVQSNASAALATLSSQQSVAARGQQFSALINRFADVPRIANFVLGRYGAQLRTDPALNTQWVSTFQTYMIAAYEDNLNKFRGSNFHVTGSVERVPGRDVVVRSEMTPTGGAQPTQVQWRILKNGAGWKVVDVSLVTNGNEIWLAQQQQRNFLAQLDRTNGDVAGLITSVQQITERLRARISAHT